MNIRKRAFAELVCVLLLLVLAMVLASCGGSGTGSISLDASMSGDSYVASDASRSTGRLVTKEEISSLPAWQQELLSDPGWNQPYITPREATLIEPPSFEMLIEETREAMEAGVEIQPRSFNFGAKSASWTDQGGFGGETIIKGEYPFGPRDTTPDYGCNTDELNESGTGNAVEDLIAAKAMPLQRISYVLEGQSTANYFNATGGSGNDMQSAVYQLFSDNRDVDLNRPGAAEIAELCYNSGVLGDGIGPGGDCSAAEAFEVSGKVWHRFNARFNAMPGLAATALYNVLVAPQAELGPEEISTADVTTGQIQPFFFGTVSGCYGGGAIVSVTASESACDTFNGYLSNSASSATDITFCNPVYGIFLKHWQNMRPGDPWNGPLGWPVFGPRVYNNGAANLDSKGEYFAWGFWFEHGFIWWVDYNQDTYPETPDEAVTYFYTGSNVYCNDGEYQLSAPSFYGGEGDLGGVVNVDAPLSDDSSYYEVGLDSPDGLGTVTLDMNAQAYGGTTANGEDVGNPQWGECLYKYYVWSFRDGTILPPGAAFDPAQKMVSHTYGASGRNLESTYVVRVQVTDANDEIAYFDSKPIHLGHAASASVLILRNDNGEYPENLQALTDDLDILKAEFPDFSYLVLDYSPENVELAKNFGVVIWYRGGPVTETGTPQETRYTDEETQHYQELLSAAVPVVHVTQNASIFGQFHEDPTWGTLLNYYHNYTADQYFIEIYDEVIPTSGGWTWETWSETMLGVQWYQSPYPSVYSPSSSHNGGSNYYRYMFPTSGRLGDYWYWAADYGLDQMGEDYNGPGSSGKYPYSYNTSPTDNDALILNPGEVQVCAIRTSQDLVSGSTPQLGLYVGSSRAASWGNDEPGFFQYVIGYPWANVEIKRAYDTGTGNTSATMERWEMLQNILAGMKEDVFEGDGFEVFSEYTGDPEVVQVKPVFWADDGSYLAGPAGTALNYPDPSSENIFRNTSDLNPYVGAGQKPGDGGYDSPYIVRAATDYAGDNELNGNDVTFQYPWYGYIDYGFDMAAGGGDDTYFVGGLLVDDPFNQWVRQPGSTGGFGRPVAGYYTNSTGLADAATRASYGPNGANLSFESGTGMITYEAIAHWPEGLTYGAAPAYLGWSLYPGHTVVQPVSPYPEYGIELPFARYQLDFDVDPNSPSPPAARDNGFWLEPLFNFFQDPGTHGGRLVEFDYSLVKGWDPDMDGDGIPGEPVDDKFPVRCRVYGDYNAYVSQINSGLGYPDNFAAPTMFSEMGCFVSDTSAGDPALYIFDDGANPNPVDSITPITFDTFDLDLWYGIGAGTGPYDIELDANYDPAAGANLLDSFGVNDPGQVYPVATGIAEGMQADTVTITQPVSGYYSVALLVTDSLGAQDILWYIDPIFAGGMPDIEGDPANDDPDIVVSFNDPDFELDIFYEVLAGWHDFDVDLDSDYTGVFDSPISVATGLTDIGTFNHQVTISQADGDYTMALRLTDSLGNSDVYVIPDTITLNSAVALRGEWWSMNGGIANTGLSSQIGPSSYNEDWSYYDVDLYTQYTNGPVFGSDGTVYISSSNGYVLAFNPDGTFKWQTPVDMGTVYTTPAIGFDGTIYVVDSSSDLWMIDPVTGANSEINGTPSSGYNCSPTIGDDGTIYWGDNNGYINAAYPDGSSKWRHFLGRSCGYNTIGVRDMGGTTALYVADATGYLSRVDDLGPGSPNFRYQIDMGGYCYGGVVLDSTDKVIYFDRGEYELTVATDTGSGFTEDVYDVLSSSYRAYRNTPNLREVGGNLEIYWNGWTYAGHLTYSGGSFSNYWTHALSGTGYYANTAVDADGKFYAASEGDEIWCLDSTGSVVWSSPYYNDPNSIGIGDDGRIYFADQNRYMRCLGF